MSTKFLRSTLPLIVGAIVVNPTLARAAPGDAVIQWPIALTQSVVGDPAAVLGPPDCRETTLADYHYVWFRNLDDLAPPVTYPALAELLGVAPSVLATADIIAFEGNGGGAPAGGGWESSLWFFTDLVHGYAETFNEVTGHGTITTGRRARFTTGSINSASYAKYFGLASCGAQVISWILVNVPNDINVSSRNFSVWVSGAFIGEGSPDPDAIGILRHSK